MTSTAAIAGSILSPLQIPHAAVISCCCLRRLLLLVRLTQYVSAYSHLLVTFYRTNSSKPSFGNRFARDPPSSFDLCIQHINNICNSCHVGWLSFCPFALFRSMTALCSTDSYLPLERRSAKLPIVHNYLAEVVP